MTTPEITLPPLPMQGWPTPTSARIMPIYTDGDMQTYARLAMAPLQERIRELEYAVQCRDEAVKATEGLLGDALLELAALRAQQPVAMLVQSPSGFVTAQTMVPMETLVNEPLYAAPVADDKAQEPVRKFTGPGHLEDTGYIPAGSAKERDGDKVLVPKEPTRLMNEAAEREYHKGNSTVAQIYRAMLAAALKEQTP